MLILVEGSNNQRTFQQIPKSIKLIGAEGLGVVWSFFPALGILQAGGVYYSGRLAILYIFNAREKNIKARGPSNPGNTSSKPPWISQMFW